MDDNWSYVRETAGFVNKHRAMGLSENQLREIYNKGKELYDRVTLNEQKALPTEINFFTESVTLENMFLNPEFCDLAGIPYDKVYEHGLEIRAALSGLFMQEIQKYRSVRAS